MKSGHTPNVVDATAGLGRDAFLMASMGVGSIIGSIFISVIKPDASNRAKYLLGSILLMGVTLSVLGFSHSTWLSLAILMLIGACTGIFNLQAMTLFQLTPPPELRGRVMAFILSATSAALPLGVLLAGALGEWTDNNSQLIFMLAGVCIALTTLIAAFSDNLKLFLKGSSDTKTLSDTPAVEA
jgi:MFS family permease